MEVLILTCMPALRSSGRCSGEPALCSSYTPKCFFVCLFSPPRKKGGGGLSLLALHICRDLYSGSNNLYEYFILDYILETPAVFKQTKTILVAGPQPGLLKYFYTLNYFSPKQFFDTLCIQVYKIGIQIQYLLIIIKII